MGISKWGICPTLLYYRFRKKDEQYVANSVSIDKFERDIKEMLDAGYASLSLKEISEAKKTGADISSKNFCVVFQGGYEDNYSVAFPVIQRHNIHVDIFVDVDDVGRKVSSDEPDYLPRLDWGQISEMVNTKLVNIHAFWNPIGNNIDWYTGINRCVSVVKNNIDALSSKMSFYSNRTDDDGNYHKALQDSGIEFHIIPFWIVDIERLNNGAIPFICIDDTTMIFDAMEEFCDKCEDRLNRDEFVLPENIETFWKKDLYNSVELPIEEKPLVRNFLRHAFPLSVVAMDRKDKAELFVIYEYIDVVFRPWYHLFDYDNTFYKSWDIINSCVLKRDFIVANGINVVECIINGFNSGYYCDMWIDTYYIPGKPGYNEYHLSHFLLAYSYDKERNVIKTMTYTRRGKYEELDVAPEDIIKACSNSYFKCLNFIKHNKESQLAYKKDELVRRLKNYMTSQYTFSISSKFNKYDNNQFCNKKACEEFPKYLLKNAQIEHIIHTVPLYGFLEHKKCMGWRLKWLLDHEGMEDNIVAENEIYSLKMYQLCMNLALKYNVTKREKVLSHLLGLLEEINKREAVAIARLLHLFES